jgi:site-specific recombinase XerD
MTMYAAGLRVAEVTHLRVADIDGQRMVIRVEQGKGRKDRHVMLSPHLRTVLQQYWRAQRPPRCSSQGLTATPSRARASIASSLSV